MEARWGSATIDTLRKQVSGKGGWRYRELVHDTGGELEPGTLLYDVSRVRRP